MTIVVTLADLGHEIWFCTDVAKEDDLLLRCVPSDMTDGDLEKQASIISQGQEKKTPVLIKRGSEMFVYGQPEKGGIWKITKLNDKLYKYWYFLPIGETIRLNEAIIPKEIVRAIVKGHFPIMETLCRSEDLMFLKRLRGIPGAHFSIEGRSMDGCCIPLTSFQEGGTDKIRALFEESGYRALGNDDWAHCQEKAYIFGNTIANEGLPQLNAAREAANKNPSPEAEAVLHQVFEAVTFNSKDLIAIRLREMSGFPQQVANLIATKLEEMSRPAVGPSM